MLYGSCLQDELKVLFPGIRISEKQMILDEENIDLFLVYAVSTVLYYQKELKKLEVRGIINCVFPVRNVLSH
jgi:hypothetical protein